MSRETLAAIEAALSAHIASLLEGIDTRPVVSGWVVAVEVETLEDGVVCWDNDYSIGETTSRNKAVGLATWVADRLRGIQAEPDFDDDDEDVGP